jgi:hypothetical protein
MNQAQQALMSVEGLEAYALRIETDINSLGVWTALAGTKAGQDLVSHLNDKLDAVRSIYAKIPAFESAAPCLLAGLQGAEEEITSMLKKLTDSESYKNSLDAELQFVLNMINRRKQTERERVNSIVSQKAVEQRNNDDG